MITTLKFVAKRLLLSTPWTKEWYLQREFLAKPPSCKGTYASFSEAAAAAPRERLAGFNHEIIPEFYKKNIDHLNPGDYAVIFWLSRLLPEAKFVIELGGSIGMGYYGFRRYLQPFPADLRWTICEVPETVRMGRDIARERNEVQLTFTDQREISGVADIYATFGAIQYIEEPFSEIIGSLSAKPRHILINRVPFSEGSSFITLQNNGSWFSPYKVVNKDEFIKSMQAIDYDLVDEWEVSRSDGGFHMLPGSPNPSYRGMYFRLKSVQG
jgi:putative methyltransferase (TIGR04325 family)